MRNLGDVIENPLQADATGGLGAPPLAAGGDIHSSPPQGGAARAKMPPCYIRYVFVKCMLTSWVLLLPAISALYAGCGGTAERQKGRLRVFVSIPPQACFVERVGSSHVEVEVLVGPGQSPATYEPTPEQMTNLSQADLYFRVGLPFEARLLEKIRATLKELRVMDTREGIKLRSMGGAHAGGRPDPHIWLDPKLVEIQATTICKKLSRLDPANAAEYETNLQAFKADLRKVDAKIARALAPLKGRKFYVFHPSYGYFGDAYNLTQVAVEIEGKEPSARQLATLIENAKQDSVQVIFVQPQFSTKSAEAIAEAIGGVVVPMDPLSRGYLKNLEDMADRVAQALGRSR